MRFASEFYLSFEIFNLAQMFFINKASQFYLRKSSNFEKLTIQPMFNTIKRSVLVLILGLLISSSSFAQEKLPVTDTPPPVDVPMTSTPENSDAKSGGTLYGEEPKLTATVVSFADLVASPEKYENMEVVVTGNVNDVCQAEGCWLVLGDGNKEIMVKTLHVFVVPKDSYDNTAVVNGVFNIKEISEEQARHFNDESKKTKIKSEDIKGPQKMFVIKAAGIKLTKGEGKSGSEAKDESCCDKSKSKTCTDKKD